MTVNQRFEVFFPEKRPFFLENAGYFQTPINLFFSRRIADPQFGGRVTGKDGRMGGRGAGDRRSGAGSQGRGDDPLHDDRAFNGVIARRSASSATRASAASSRRRRLRFFIQSRSRRPTRVFALIRSGSCRDRRPLPIPKDLDGTHSSDGAYDANLSRSSRTLTYSADYTDIGKDFRTALGFVPRTDIRQATQFATYRWHPKSGRFTSFGPNSFLQGTWDHTGQLQDWTVRYPFEMNFKAQSGYLRSPTSSHGALRRHRVPGIREPDQREHELFRWMDVGMLHGRGHAAELLPAGGRPRRFSPTSATRKLSLTFRPASGLLLDETYIYSHLGTRTSRRRTIFDNHIVRSRVNYQFTRELSLRAILDYNAVLSDPSLVALDRTKHLTGISF